MVWLLVELAFSLTLESEQIGRYQVRFTIFDRKELLVNSREDVPGSGGALGVALELFLD